MLDILESEHETDISTDLITAEAVREAIEKINLVIHLERIKYVQKC